MKKRTWLCHSGCLSSSRWIIVSYYCVIILLAESPLVLIQHPDSTQSETKTLKNVVLQYYVSSIVLQCLTKDSSVSLRWHHTTQHSFSTAFNQHDFLLLLVDPASFLIANSKPDISNRPHIHLLGYKESQHIPTFFTQPYCNNSQPVQGQEVKKQQHKNTTVSIKCCFLCIPRRFFFPERIFFLPFDVNLGLILDSFSRTSSEGRRRSRPLPLGSKFPSGWMLTCDSATVESSLLLRIQAHAAVFSLLHPERRCWSQRPVIVPLLGSWRDSDLPSGSRQWKPGCDSGVHLINWLLITSNTLH